MKLNLPIIARHRTQVKPAAPQSYTVTAAEVSRLHLLPQVLVTVSFKCFWSKIVNFFMRGEDRNTLSVCH